MNSALPSVQPANSAPRTNRGFGLLGLCFTVGVFLANQFWPPGFWVCTLLPLWLIALALCAVALCVRPRWPAVLGLVVWAALSYWLVSEAQRRDRGNLYPSEYPQLIKDLGGRFAYLPRAIPSEAKDVRVRASNVYIFLVPGPDKHIEVRYILPPAMAVSVLQAADAAALPPDPDDRASEFAGLLSTADDHDSHTPLAPEFTTRILYRPGAGMTRGGVTVNPSTGEVIYWLIEV